MLMIYYNKPNNKVFNTAINTLARLNELCIRPARGGLWTTSAIDSIKRRLYSKGTKKPAVCGL
jgi:hypothetical protein